MAKSKQATGNKQGRSDKSGGDAVRSASPAGNTTGTGNAQLMKSQSEPATDATTATGLPQQPDAAGQSAIEALKQDHRRVDGLFSDFESATEDQRKQELVAMICTELNIHTRLEEEIFYPACREAIDDEDIMDEAQVEHDAAKLLIADLTEASSDDPFFDAKVKLLSEMIKHHVAEEEKPGEGVLAKAEEHGVDNPSLASELAERKQELQRRAARLRPTRAVSFNLDISNLMEEGMARNSDMDRDDRGRFTSGRGGSRNRYVNDDDRGGRGGSRSRYEDDDDDRGGRGRSRGGWFGDSEGHSRAARSRFEDDDDDRGGRGRSRSRDDDDDDGRGHGRGGWFGDSEGHSRAARSRRDDDDDDRGGRSRGGGSRSRSRDDDDDDGRGWFGDSRGHAEAARRGWTNRR